MDNWVGLNNVYAYRDDNLKQLGYASYEAYLRSPLWKSIRQRVHARAQQKCERCQQPSQQVHHRAYDPATLRGDSIHALMALCERCHRTAESVRRKHGDVGAAPYLHLHRVNGWLQTAPRKPKDKQLTWQQHRSRQKARTDLQKLKAIFVQTWHNDAWPVDDRYA